MSNHKIVCAAPSYIKKHGKPQLPLDLEKHNCIVFGENDVWQFRHKKTKTVSSLKNPSGNIRCDNGEIIKELALSGIGITLKSSRDVEDELKSGRLVALLPDYEICNETEFYVVYPAGKNTAPKIKAFIEFFGEKLREKEREIAKD